MNPMKNMAVDCSWAHAQLEDDASLLSSLPVELLAVIRQASGSQYLEAVASATLLPACTDKLAAYYRDLLPEISARWLLKVDASPFDEHVLILSSLAKVLPFAPYLKPCAKDLIAGSKGLSNFAQAGTSLTDLDDEKLRNVLLAFFRLFTYDVQVFKSYVHPALLSTIFKHNSLPVRYLAIQCFSQVMGLADALSEKLVVKHVGKQAIRGPWEAELIDFRLVKLLEERRWKRQETLLNSLAEQKSHAIVHMKTIAADDLLPNTANLGGVLLPRLNFSSHIETSLVHTPTTIQCLREIGLALRGIKSILLYGEPGSGKTSLVLEAARELNKSSSMITLHLNEQTDAKSLLGLYTSSEETGSFVWQAGVLTQAIREGSWILIEDIDKAPADVLGVIRPVLQDGELYLPSRKETLKAADGFRIFATIRTTGRPSSSSSQRRSWIVNDRCWSNIDVTTPDHLEIRDILGSKHSMLNQLIPSIMGVHERVELEYQRNHALKSTTARTSTLRDLLKWCRRTSARLQLSEATSGLSFSEATKLDIYKDAVDCYAGHLASLDSWSLVADCIAEQMHIAPQQAHHCLKDDLPIISDNKFSIQIGRATLQKSPSASRKPKRLGPFAFTRQARLTVGKIAAATSQSEPVLLVGETGVGKTTLVQHIAGLLGQSLTVVNLSQQSEASDLLGGLKPVTTRSLMIPVVDQFNSLFDDTFSAKKNEKFLSSIQRFVGREQWQRVLDLWQQAVQMAKSSLHVAPVQDPTEETIRTAKRRKLDTPKYQGLRDRWNAFSLSFEQLRVQVERAERHLTFTFVEGRIVQSVREGGWLLLDEINLASSDTLDSISSLLTETDQEHPYLHLTEAGNMERITAHPDFRVFAAMNPATDTGKKDLTPGIRSRFTEICVLAGDSDVHDLVNLIETYLGALLDADRRAAFDLANLYLAIKALNQEHRIVDGAGDDPHFTIRSLVRCLLYVQKHTADYGLRRAILEGANMSFCTMLNRESESMVLPLIDQHILSGVKNVRSLLAQTPRPPSDGIEYVSFKHHLVLKGGEDATAQLHYIRTPSVERNLLNLARATSMHRFPILLQGPTSSGKTSMVEYLAKSTGNRFVRVNNHEHTDLQEYLGSYASGNDGKLEFREGVLVQALRQGHWIVLDELNLAPSDVLEALNRLLDDNQELLIPETQEIVRPHPGFMLFATQNPAGLYGGRKRLSRAFRNRFLELHFDDIPEEELEVILQKRSQIAPSFCTQIVAVYNRLSLQRQSSRLFEQQNSFATLRDLFRWASRPMDDRTQLATQGFMLLGERVRDSAERQIVKDIIEEVIRVKLDISALYGLDEIPTSVRNGSVIWTPAMRRLFVLVSTALQNNEPVLLIGETGCGKTQICQTVAQASQHQLNVYNAHTNTETGDLIGSQRPARHRSEADDELKRQLSDLLQGSAVDGLFEKESLESLLHKFDGLDVSKIDEQSLVNVRASIAKHNSLFEWVDGSLVRAMKDGQHFLLDEISLAEDSVLERLNSLLEPSRIILLAEKGPSENLVVAASGFQFLATMNPGGDYGKRELSAALRNRLTEVWVPQLAEADDVLPILESKLSSELRSYGKVMLEFSGWFRSNFLGAATEAVPLRDLITWADFLQQNLQVDASTTLCHGAAMVFIDSLGANPAGMMSNATANVKEARALCLQKLAEITQTPSLPVYDESISLTMTREHIKVGDFTIPRAVVSIQKLELVFEAPTTLKNTMRLVRALQMQRPVLLEGSPGVGKTAIVTALAQAAGKSLTRINLSDQTDLMDLFGADVPMENEDVGKFAWRDGPLLQAMQAGGWVLLDEMNLASQSVLEGLNSCLDHRQEVFIAELDRTFACHPCFKLFAAQNPHHQGGGRKGLPKSFVNRFTVVYADPFEKDDLYQICCSTFPSIDLPRIKSVVDMVSEVQRYTESSAGFSVGGPWEFNLRDVSRWLQMLQQTPSLPAGHYFDALVSQRLRTSHQKDLADSVCAQFAKKDYRANLYHSLSPEVFQVGTAFLHRDTSLQKTESNRQTISTRLLPYAQSVIEAVNRRWPVVIADTTNTSSTELIYQLAAIAGATITTVPLNADTDTMDLIGGLEQHDPHQDLTTLKAMLQQALDNELPSALIVNDSTGISAILSLYSICKSPHTSLQDLQACIKSLSTLSDRLQYILSKIEDLLTLQQGRQVGFLWNDGVLVEALQDGRWLVLENANTCNPAVLDRLNSLLEPKGVLIVSEQHSSTDSSRTIQPHPNFRIFLTIDPRHGELSRAMRNRSLELCIDEPALQEVDSMALGYPCASDLYRFRLLAMTSSHDVDLALKPLLANVGLDHISESDRGTLEWSVGANCSLFSTQSLLRDQLKARSWLPSAFKNHGMELQGRLLSQSNLQECQLLQYLPLPAVNEPLMALSSDQLLNSHIGKFAWAHQILLRIHSVLATVDQARGRSQMSQHNEKNLLERSLAQGKTKVDRTPPFADFLVATSTALQKAINIDSGESSIRCVQNVLAFANDILRLSAEVTLRPGMVSAYVQNGHDLVHNGSEQSPALQAALSMALDLFAQKSQLKSGRSLYLMWDRVRPLTASSEPQLHDLMRLEELLRRLDYLSISSDSLTHIMNVKKELVEVYRSILEGTCSDITLFEELESQIMRLETVAGDAAHATNHFSGAFKSILQLATASGTRLPGHLHTSLAKSATSLEETCSTGRAVPQAFVSMLEMVSVSSLDREWDAWRDNFGLALLQKISTSEEQSISSIDWQQTEVKVLLQTLSCFGPSFDSGVVVDGLRNELRSILSETLSCHSELLSVGNRPLPYRYDVMESELEFAARVSPTHYFRTIYQDYLHEPLAWIRSEPGPASLGTTGAALVATSLGLLRLLVPDQPYDPALTSQVAHACFKQRETDVQNFLAAQRLFEANFTGQKTSLLIRMTEEELFRIGDEPAVAAVVRPSGNGLDLLNVEFTNLLRAVVDSQPEKVLLAAFPGRWQNDSMSKGDARVEAEKLLQNIEHICKRLRLADRAFDDLTKPIVWILQCLALGIRMLVASQSSLPQASQHIQESVNRTPLLGLNPGKIMRPALHTKQSLRLNTEDCVGWLEHLVVVQSIETTDFTLKGSQILDLVKVTDLMYETWKANLERDQETAVARSKYYAYRGDDDLDESQEKQAVTQMFPTFDESQDNGESIKAKTGYDARANAVKLSQLQHCLFTGGHRGVGLAPYIYQSLEHISNDAGKHSSEVGVVSSQDLLPLVLLKLDQQMLTLDATERAQRINIYTDGDVIEARRLHKLVKSVVAKFRWIHNAWPEHAVPLEVLDFCREVYRFNLKDPIAKLLTKTEKLLDIVSQWQAVASREYSIADSVDELTKLIISWRQLELSSWSRLLDLEQQANESNARSWYFMLYEAIILNPRQVLDQEKDLFAYVKELASTLEDFLTSTSCGEFSCRLQMCRSFQQLLRGMVAQDQSLQPVLSCVVNVISHPSRYQQAVESALAKGRAELERKLREQIKLASWKDTNVSALRESARRSHFKLFKIVRKYRSLLAQPLQLQAAQPQVSGQSSSSLLDLLPLETPTEAVESALIVASKALTQWSARPERLRNPFGAAARMKLVVRREGDRFAASDALSQFLSSFQTAMKDLRSRTPSTLTEDNQGQINYLKGLKQTLFSDTLRSIKQMGVKRNLGSIELEKQRSRASVLASIPVLESKSYPRTCASANNDFHEVLDLMPAVRNALTEHSEQLRVVDVRRSAAYADGLLSILIHQREVVASCELKIDVCNEAVERLGHFARQPIDQFEHASSSFHSKQGVLTRRLRWLPELLAVSMKVLQVQMKHSEADLGVLIDRLSEQADKMKHHLKDVCDLPHLSAGIRSVRENEFAVIMEDLLNELRTILEDGIVKHPESAAVLVKLVPWADMTVIEIDKAINGFSQPSVLDLDRNICDCLDTVFETVQQVSSISDRLPDSTEINGWLAKTSRRKAEMMDVMRVAEVAQKLAIIEGNLAHISSDGLAAGVSLVVVALPILEQYLLICQYIAGQSLALHCETARMTVVLTRTLTTIAKEGFCSPQEASKGEEQSGPVESGTGLGDGTGAEDISKDVGDDEDLSELAQAENEKFDGQELEASKDAVDMGKDDMKGDDGGAEESASEEDESSQSGDEDGSDLDEETGSVDNLDPSAVDEKMWEGLDAQKDKELESEKAKGEKSEEQTAKQEREAKGDDTQQDEAADDVEDSGSGGDDEGEAVGRDETDQAESNMQEEKPLDLPDEMLLNGDENEGQDDRSDDGMADMSDVEDEAGLAEPEDADDGNGGEDKEPADDAADNEQEGAEDEQDDGLEKQEAVGKGYEDDIMEDQPEPELSDEDDDHDIRNEDMKYDIDEDQAGEMGEGGAVDAEDEAADSSREKVASNRNKQIHDRSDEATSDNDNEKGNDETGGVTRGGRSEAEVANPQVEALKKLGDMLERWHQRHEIHQATQDHTEQPDDIDMADADFEHIQNEEDNGDTQALGAASKEQAQALDQSKAIEDDEMHGQTEQAPADVAEDDARHGTMEERFSQLQTHSVLQQDSGPGAIMPDQKQEPGFANGQQEREDVMKDEDLDDAVNDRLANGGQHPQMSQAEASQLWSHYSTKVQHISLILTEQLRLILAPTLATKLRGDFRTGKRLNIKRIIPYIASGYKRDKIWMRRSVPSKRNYQIMLALDDSKSMMEGGAGALAFETLAMLCKSLSMLEVGDLCVVGFGNEEHIRVAHPFGQPFGNEAGVKIFQNFTFNQPATDVKKMVKESIALFQDARVKSTGSQSELWQLQLIISDGICEDHETVARLVRQAKVEKIMIVFVIVDGSGESILDLKQASFEKDNSGEMKLSMRRYLDRFPFPYYLVVRDVRDLPAVLATALKGWFAQVVGGNG